MPQSKTANRQIVLNSRRSARRRRTTSAPNPLTCRRRAPVLLRTVWLSLDPYMRGRMSDAPSMRRRTRPADGRRHRQPVVSSNLPAFREGGLVAGAGWQDYALSDGSGLIPLGRDFAHPSYALGVLGMPGFTAYTGLLTIGEPKAGETVVVAAASGAVGAVVGQIAKLKGCRVVGVAGGTDKCAYVTDTLGFDVCVDHRDPAFAAKLKEHVERHRHLFRERRRGRVRRGVRCSTTMRACPCAGSSRTTTTRLTTTRPCRPAATACRH